MTNKDQRQTNRLAGRPPITSTDSDAPGSVLYSYMGKQIVILSSHQGLDLPKGTHAHDSYEFVIPYGHLSGSLIGSKHIDFAKGHIYCINPWVEHGFSKEMTNVRLCGIHMDTDLVHRVAEEMKVKLTYELPMGDFKLTPEQQGLLSTYCEEVKYKQSGYELMEGSLSTMLAVSLLRTLKNPIERRSSSTAAASKSIQQAIDYIHAHYMGEITSKEIAQITNMGWYSFIRAFRSHTGKNPHDYMMDLKLDKALRLLTSPDHTITDISQLCGFSSHSHFASTFKKRMGVSPSSYRRHL